MNAQSDRSVIVDEHDNTYPKFKEDLVRGDEAAWEAFDREFGGRVIAVAKKYGLQAEAEDLRQEIMLKVLTAYDPQRGGLRNFVLQRARYLAIENRQRRANEAAVSLESAAAASGLTLEEQLADEAAVPPSESFEKECDSRSLCDLREEALPRVATKVSELNFKAFHRHIFDSVPIPEVARQFGITRNNMDQIKYRLSDLLKDEVTNLLIEKEVEAAVRRLKPCAESNALSPPYAKKVEPARGTTAPGDGDGDRADSGAGATAPALEHINPQFRHWAIVNEFLGALSYLPTGHVLLYRDATNRVSIASISRELTVGRRTVAPSPTGLALPSDGTLSREHFRVILEKDAAWVVDLGARNRTFLNGERVKSRAKARLKNGDIIRAGDYQFMFLVPLA